MKVAVKDLNPNPYRDMKNYPIDEEKVKELARSIKQTGFWDNVLARKKDGKIEIAYGHHRWIALKKAKVEFVDIPIKDLDDPTMLKIMANENMDEWKMGPAVIDETVRVTQEFLEGHIEEAKKIGQVKLKSGTEVPDIGWLIISRFIEWPEKRVRNSLKRIKAIDEGVVSAEVIKELPTDNSATLFTEIAEELGASEKEQKKAVEKIVESENFGKEAMKGELIDAMFSRKELQEIRATEKLKDFSDVIQEIADLISALSGKLEILLKYKKEFQSEIYQKTFERLSYEAAKKRLLTKFTKLEEVLNEQKLIVRKN